MSTSAVSASEGAENRRTYHDDNCGFRFQYPRGWTIQKNDRCSVAVSPGDLAERMASNEADVWSFSISIEEGTFLAEAADAGFDFQHGRWVLAGFDSMPGEAEPFESPPWWGLRGSSSVRCYHPRAGNAGFCHAVTIIAQSATVQTGDARIVKIEGFRQSRTTIDQVLRTFRFDSGAL
jgi:hypothetical protein